MVYADSPPASKRCRWKMSAAEDPSIKLRPIKSEPYRVAKVTSHTVIIDINGLHSFVAVDRVTLTQAAYRVSPYWTEQNWEKQRTIKQGTAPRSSQGAKPSTGKEAQTTLKEDGTSATATENMMSAEQHGWNTRTMKDSQKLPTEHAVNWIKDSWIKCQRTPYRVCWYRYDTNDNTWKAENVLTALPPCAISTTLAQKIKKKQKLVKTQPKPKIPRSVSTRLQDRLAANNKRLGRRASHYLRNTVVT